MRKVIENAALVTIFAAILAGCNLNSKQETMSAGFLEGAGDTASTGITIDGTTYSKTSEVYVIPVGKRATIAMEDDSSWSGYITPTEEESKWKGVFIKDRKVILSSFIMSQYEVTQELYNAVMGTNPSYYTSNAAEGETQNLRPVESVSHYMAVAFCNELTKKVMTEDDVVYYSDNGYEKVYTVADAKMEKEPYMKLNKKGYRLPTEAEWEYAARGGNPNSEEWKTAFGKGTIKDNAKIYDGSKYLETDDNLDTTDWYSNNAEGKTHEVGTKEPNSLGIYDMCGNEKEWCWDWYDDETDYGYNPDGPYYGTYRVVRGGTCGFYAAYCCVSRRASHSPGYAGPGFRIVRYAE